MCLQCMANAKTIIEDVIPGYTLVQATKDARGFRRGQYGLVQCNDPVLSGMAVRSPTLRSGWRTANSTPYLPTIHVSRQCTISITALAGRKPTLRPIRCAGTDSSRLACRPGTIPNSMSAELSPG